jgi:hypothetical protein
MHQVSSNPINSNGIDSNQVKFPTHPASRQVLPLPQPLLLRAPCWRAAGPRGRRGARHVTRRVLCGAAVAVARERPTHVPTPITHFQPRGQAAAARARGRRSGEQ